MTTTIPWVQIDLESDGVAVDDYDADNFFEDVEEAEKAWADPHGYFGVDRSVTLDVFWEEVTGTRREQHIVGR